MPRHSITLLVLFSATLPALPLPARGRETGFLNRTAKVAGVTYRHQVYIPAAWSKKQKWPVILFLHGAGERGDDGLIQTEVGIGTAIRRHADRFPCLVVMPQCRTDTTWIDPVVQAQALQALDQTIKEFKGDPQRVYLTGLSMGGFGTWSLSARYPGKFAALISICGGVRWRGQAIPPADASSADPYATIAEKIGKTPVWVFHGADDPVISVGESRQIVEALNASGGHVLSPLLHGVNCSTIHLGGSSI